MSAFALLVKSHGPDLAYAERLVESIRRYNVEDLPVHLVVPAREYDDFARLATGPVSVLAEEEFSEHLVTGPVGGYLPGYINQEIVKLAFWESGLADNYLCVDSDLEFVRDFRASDFMVDSTTPFTFATEDAALRTDPTYYDEHWVGREQRLRRIQRELGVETERLLTVHGHAVFSGTVLRAFRDRFLAPRGWDYRDALEIAPYEPTWYTQWLLKDRTIPIVLREPIVKTFHNAAQYLDYVVRHVTSDDVARGYVAVILNSNFSRDAGLLSLEDSPERALGRYASAGLLSAATLARLLSPMRSVLSSATSSGATAALHRQIARKPES